MKIGKQQDYYSREGNNVGNKERSKGNFSRDVLSGDADQRRQVGRMP